MACQVCGSHQPTKKVTFCSIIGMIVLMQWRTFKAEMCKSCLHRKFFEYTGTSLVLGWWGMISMVLTPITVIYNLVVYLVAVVGLGSAAKSADRTPAQSFDTVQASPAPVRRVSAANLQLKVGSLGIPLIEGAKLEERHIPGSHGQRDGIVAEVHRDPLDHNVIGLKNLSASPWKVVEAEAPVLNVPAGHYFRVSRGTRINFGQAAAEVA